MSIFGSLKPNCIGAQRLPEIGCILQQRGYGQNELRGCPRSIAHQTVIDPGWHVVFGDELDKSRALDGGSRDGQRIVLRNPAAWHQGIPKCGRVGFLPGDGDGIMKGYHFPGKGPQSQTVCSIALSRPEKAQTKGQQANQQIAHSPAWIEIITLWGLSHR
jgi:hypothetical protein